MNTSALSEIVHCLNCGETSLYTPSDMSELKCRSCGQSYPIENSVPVFLFEIHKKQGSVFNYIDHYQIDGVEHDYFAERDAGTEHVDKRVHQTIFSLIKKKSGRVLDVGCGRAWVAQHLCPQNYDVVSMDISLENTSRALKTYPFDNHTAVVADAFSLPFNENVFDVIIAAEIVEHVADPKVFIRKLMRVLKPGGLLIVTTPYKEKIRYSLCVHCNRLTPMHAHIHSFDENKLTSLYQGND